MWIHHRRRSPGLAALLTVALVGPGAMGPALAQEDDPATASAADCFNPELLRVGSRYRMGFRGEGADASATTARAAFMVSGVSVIDGEDVTVSVASGTITEGGTAYRLVQRAYTAVDPGTPATRLYRLESRRSDADGNTLAVTKRFTPPMTFRYDLAPGESYQQRFRRETVRRGDEVDSRRVVDVVSRVRFAGRETVQGPAGSMTACRFVEERMPSGQTHTYWFSAESGLALRERVTRGEEVVQTNTLLSGSVNGVAMQ